MLYFCENIRPESVPVRRSEFDVCAHLAITWYQQLTRDAHGGRHDA